MTFHTGQNGQLVAKPAESGVATAIGNLKNWSINFQINTLDTTCLRDTDKTILYGTRSFSGSSTLLYYSENQSNIRRLISETFYAPSTKGTNFKGKEFGINRASGLTDMYLRLFKPGGTDLLGDFKFYCAITSFAMTCAVDEVVQAEITFEGHGAPYETSIIK